MKVLVAAIFFNSCVTVSESHWSWCKTKCESHGGLLKAGKKFNIECCECKDSSIVERDNLPRNIYHNGRADY